MGLSLYRLGLLMSFFSSISNFVSDAFATVDEILKPVTTAVPTIGTVLSRVVGDTLGSDVEGALQNISDVDKTIQSHPAEALAAIYGANYALEATAASGAEAMGSTAAVEVVDASAPTLVGAPTNASAGSLASSSGAFESALQTATSNAPTASAGMTIGQTIAATNAGLNLASSGIKLATLGKTMNSTSATANGLTGALAPSPLETPSGLITTTPQGPLTAGPVASEGGFMGMDNQTLMVIGIAAIGVYYLAKSGNLKG